jgi:hypothetical protein
MEELLVLIELELVVSEIVSVVLLLELELMLLVDSDIELLLVE